VNGGDGLAFVLQGSSAGIKALGKGAEEVRCRLTFLQAWPGDAR
jgi:hypothetical protein